MYGIFKRICIKMNRSTLKKLVHTNKRKKKNDLRGMIYENLRNKLFWKVVNRKRRYASVKSKGVLNMSGR